jgi:phosphate transport system substrate-binding protein
MASSKIWKVGVLIVTVIMVGTLFAGCLGGDEEKPKLVQTGSSTVLPCAVAWAEEFDGADISVSGGGSSHGINALLKGEADLGDASRLMKGSDYEKVGGSADDVNSDGTAKKAAPTGVWPEKWVVGFDVLTVVVNKDNDFIDELNYTQLYTIFTDDDPAEYWDEVPGLTGAPHEKIEIYAPDEASGTYDFFFEEIIADWGDAGAAKSRLASGDGVYHPNADDNVILRAVKENEYAIGFFGYAYYTTNKDQIKAVAIGRDDSPKYIPSAATVADYPMARPLHIYTDGVPKEDDVINEYLQYVLSDEGQDLVPVVGYVPLDLVDANLRTTQMNKLKNA